jgi:predicted kinase
VEAITFIGIQGSGKTSFYLSRFFQTHIRLSLDMLRTRHRLDLLLRSCIDAKQQFVLDNTNVTASQREPYIALARTARFRVTGYYFDTPLAECLRRNELREGRERIPKRGIFGTLKQLEMPAMREGFDALYRVRPNGSDGFVIEAWGDEVQRS